MTQTDTLEETVHTVGLHFSPFPTQETQSSVSQPGLQSGSAECGEMAQLRLPGAPAVLAVVLGVSPGVFWAALPMCSGYSAGKIPSPRWSGLDRGQEVWVRLRVGHVSLSDPGFLHTCWLLRRT